MASAAPLSTYATLCNDVYTPTSKPPVAMVQRVITEGNFAAKIYSVNKTMVIAYAGTDDLQDTLLEDVVGIGLTGATVTMHYTTALRIAAQAAERGTIEVCGHSLGGAYAQLVARELDVTGVTFNAPGAAHMNPTGSSGGAVTPGGVIGGAGAKLGEWLVRGTYTYNFRHPTDVVSAVGIHCGNRCRNLPMPLVNPGAAHSIVGIETWLNANGRGRAPEQF